MRSLVNVICGVVVMALILAMVAAIMLTAGEFEYATRRPETLAVFSDHQQSPAPGGISK